MIAFAKDFLLGYKSMETTFLFESRAKWKEKNPENVSYSCIHCMCLSKQYNAFFGGSFRI